MRVGILKNPNDARVALAPDGVKKLLAAGFQVSFEPGAGQKAFFKDENYVEAGADAQKRAALLQGTDILLSVESPSQEELASIPEGKSVIALFQVKDFPERSQAIATLPIQAFSLDKMPRTTIAQSMDVLSSMASLAGYKSIIMAAALLPGYFPMMMTAAGTLPPARVLVLGAGVAGLQAIATARRLGATVEAFDIRSAAKEEVQSLGARFVEVEGAQEDKSAGGYAIEQTEDFLKRQKELIHQTASKAQVVVTTANIPGKKAPLLLEARTVEAMQPGSVIVDLAAATGGNCALTQPAQTIVHNGIHIIGDSNLPSSMPLHASKLFSNNVVNFLKHICKDQVLDLENNLAQATRLS